MGKSRLAVYHIGQLVLIPTHLKIYNQSGDPVVNLSDRLLGLLIYLIDNKDSISKKSDILNELWGVDDYFTSRSLDVHIVKLRQLLRVDKTLTIHTIRSYGFQLSTTSAEFKMDEDTLLKLLQDESKVRHSVSKSKKNIEIPESLLEKQARFKKIAKEFNQ
jgi:DNA-binding winged helix-turn-helix (wHTH) protein